MRKSLIALFCLSLALPLLLGAGCTGDTGPKGDQGIQGPAGPDGPEGPDGPSGTADCVECHNDNTMLTAAIVQWRHSAHSSTELLWEVNRDPCYKCHTSEGFVTNLSGTPVVAENPTMVGCRTCHAPHTNKNFELRTTAAYTLMNGASVDKGKGNLCVACHHSRRDIRVYVTEPTSITSTRFGPHGSPQAEGYFGTGGYEYGQTIAQSSHKTGIADACVSCHMYKPIGAQVGGHTFWVAETIDGEPEMNVGACTGCHAGADTFNLTALSDYDGDGTTEGLQDEFDGLLGQLRAALVGLGLIGAAGTPEEDLSTSGIRTAVEAGAIYNFRLAISDGSRGVHNPAYILGLLQVTLDQLEALPPKKPA